MKRTRGIRAGTLIEVLITGTISAFIGIGLLAILGVHGRETRDGVGNSRALQELDAVTARIGSKAREAAAVLTVGESFANRKTYKTAVGAADTVRMVDENGVDMARYWISPDGQLWEDPTGSGPFTPFRVADSAVRIAAGGGFELPPGRWGLGLGMLVEARHRDTTYQADAWPAFYRCRN